MTESSIHLDVELDENKIPSAITWSAPDNSPGEYPESQGFPAFPLGRLR